MRCVPLVLVGVLLFLGSMSVTAQKKGADKKPDSQITQIGGKTLEQWIQEIPSRDRSKSENAIKTVLLFGPQRAYAAVPTLLEELHKHRPGIQLLDTSVRVNAIIALGAILGGAQEPNPKLVKEAVTILTRMLADTQSIVRYRAAQALGMIGPEAKSALPHLLNTVQDMSTWETRQAAAAALGRIAFDRSGKTASPKNVLRGLEEALSDTSSQVRLAAVQSLSLLGMTATAADRPRVIKLLENHAHKDLEPTVRIWAHRALMSVTNQISDEHLGPIAGMLKNQEMAARVQAAQALASVGPQAKSQLGHLLAALDDAEPQVVMASLMALGRLEKSGSSALPALRKITKDPDRPEGMKKAVAHVIDMIEGKTAKKARESEKKSGE